MNILEGLNENQKQAVLCTEGPLLILAGAGSGKTRVITHRIAHLINKKNVAPYKIFAVTFTNKAAAEMRDRIMNIVGSAGNSVFAKTFHSAAVYILRRYGEVIGIPKNFSIYDMNDQASVIKNILVEMKLDPKKIKPASIASKISEIKDKAELIKGAPIDTLIPDYFAFDFQDLYKQYHNTMAAHNALDFNDLLIKTVELFRNSPESLRALQNQWQYFMVDEYQDTNYSQYVIAKMLASETKNICVVGDDDQSIYSWRGADIRNILDFEKDYMIANVITLEENYRSTEQIINAASHLIRNNVDRKEKNVRAVNGEGESIVHCSANNEYGEAEFAVRKIVSLQLREKLANKDFAIFYRTNAQSRIFEEQLRKESVPYRVVGGQKFYDRKEIKDIVAYLKFIVNPRDMVSFLRIINVPARGIGGATIERLNEAAREKQVSAWEVVSQNLLTGKIGKGLADFIEFMKNLMAIAEDVPASYKLSSLVMQTLELSGYKKSLEEEKSTEAESRLDNLEEFMNSVFDYEVMNPGASLADFLQDIALLTSEENPEDNTDTSDPTNVVTLMTVHNAKGLEFPVVFLTGLEEGIFPHSLSVDTEEGVEEERRLCYVGITRAKERLYMSNAELRRSYNGVEYKQPSRFIEEIPSDLLETTSYDTNDFHSYGGNPSHQRGFQKSSSYSNQAPVKQYKLTPTQGNEKRMDEDIKTPHKVTNDSAFQVKDKVQHPKYGRGTIVKIEGTGDNVKLSILFVDKTVKHFLEKYTSLEKM